MNFDKSKIIPIKSDASFRKFYRRKTNKKSSIIVYVKKEKNKNLLNYDAINKLLLKNKIFTPKLLSENFSKNFIEIEDLGTKTIFDIFIKKKVNKLKIYKKILVVLINYKILIQERLKILKKNIIKFQIILKSLFLKKQIYF